MFDLKKIWRAMLIAAISVTITVVVFTLIFRRDNLSGAMLYLTWYILVPIYGVFVFWRQLRRIQIRHVNHPDLGNYWIMSHDKGRHWVRIIMDDEHNIIVQGSEADPRAVDQAMAIQELKRRSCFRFRPLKNLDENLELMKRAKGDNNSIHAAR